MKKHIKKKTVLALLSTIWFPLLLCFLAIRTYGGAVRAVLEQTSLSLSSLASLSDTLEETLEENISLKYSFVNLNGLTTRALGVNTLNERQKLSNGQLTDLGTEVDLEVTEDLAENVEQLDQFLSDRDIDFLFLLAPSKLAFYEKDFAPGYGFDTSLNFSVMLEELQNDGVSTIDMNAWFEENNWTMDQVYYKTDHHWKTEAALEAAKQIMESLSQQGVCSYDDSLFDESSWTKTVYQNWYLGSHGKRTGVTYTGADDLVLYEPNFPTNYQYSYLSSGTTTWTYLDTLLDLKYVQQKDLFDNDSYCLYMVGDFPNRRTINTEAVNAQKVLLMGDSYKIPVEYFLTTQFQEIFTVDLRYVTDGATLVQYVQELQPDLVIMCSANIYSEEVYTFGVPEYLEALEATDPNAAVEELGDAYVEASDTNGSNFTVVTADLIPGQTYTLTVDSTEYDGGEDQYIQMTLQDLSTNQSAVNRYLEADSDQTQTWIFTVPDNEDTYGIYLYAGTKGHTQQASVQVTGIRLLQGIAEDS